MKINSPRGQASFFDGIMFMLIVMVSVSLMFVSINNYSTAQDKVLRTAYFSNYLQSTAKMLYYLDVSSLQQVQSYCKDQNFHGNAPPNTGYYCKAAYDMDCSGLKNYKGHISVADLLKKDLDYTDNPGNSRTNLDDRYGTSIQLGRTALRCAMKEVMKPFTFSGYRYITEPAEASTEDDAVIYAEGQKFASDFMFSPKYQLLTVEEQKQFDCKMVSTLKYSDQLLVIRTPFKLLTMQNDAFSSTGYVLRTCLWPSNDLAYIAPPAP